MNLFTDVSSVSKHGLACKWEVMCYEEIALFIYFFCRCSCTEFHIIVCGLDSIIARRWMNGMLVRISSKLPSFLNLVHIYKVLATMSVLTQTR